MSRLKQLDNYKKHLKERYVKLIEKSNSYRYVDESMSDIAAFKAMKLLEKINQLRYLDRKLTI
tara:strand:- start:186 stop:374 length:189 start_codon:yes stop_codon:yes gene_type:complete